MLAAMLGRLDRADEAQAHVTAVREAKPDFPGHPRALMLKSLKIPELVDELVDGLQRVGLAK